MRKKRKTEKLAEKGNLGELSEKLRNVETGCMRGELILQEKRRMQLVSALTSKAKSS